MWRGIEETCIPSGHRAENKRESVVSDWADRCDQEGGAEGSGTGDDAEPLARISLRRRANSSARFLGDG